MDYSRFSVDKWLHSYENITFPLHCTRENSSLTCSILCMDGCGVLHLLIVSWYWGGVGSQYCIVMATGVDRGGVPDNDVITVYRYWGFTDGRQKHTVRWKGTNQKYSIEDDYLS